MNNSKNLLKLKPYFKNLNFYSIPSSILFIVRKRLNLILFLNVTLLGIMFGIL